MILLFFYAVTALADCQFFSSRPFLVVEPILRFNRAQLSDADCSAAATENVLRAIYGSQFNLRFHIKNWKWHRDIQNGGEGASLDGLTRNLKRLSRSLNAEFEIERIYGTDIPSAEKLLDLIFTALHSGEYIILNLDQGGLPHGSKVGHFVVAGGINREKKTVIISDSDPRFGIFELRVDRLLQLMNSVDLDSSKSRGLIKIALKHEPFP